MGSGIKGGRRRDVTDKKRGRSHLQRVKHPPGPSGVAFRGRVRHLETPPVGRLRLRGRRRAGGRGRLGRACLLQPPSRDWLEPELLGLANLSILLITDFGKSLCFAQTIPNTGAAGFLHRGTGQSWSGPFLRAFFAMGTGAVAAFGGRPGPPRAGPSKAERTAVRARSSAWPSINAERRLAKSLTTVLMSIRAYYSRFSDGALVVRRIPKDWQALHFAIDKMRR